MKKLSFYFWLFLSSGIVLLGSLVCIVHKYLPIVLYSTLNSCQGMVTSMAQMTMRHTGMLVLSGLGVALLLVMIRMNRFVLTLVMFEKKISFDDRALSTRRLQKIVSELSLDSRLKVINSEKPLAFCLGFWNARIYLSTGLLQLMDSDELEAILRHEHHHLSSKDTLIQSVSSVLTMFAWIFPFISDLVADYRLRREISADQAAISSMQTSKPLLSALRKMLQFESHPHFALSTALAEYETLEARITYLLTGTHQQKITLNFLRMGISMLTLTMLLGFSFFPVKAIEVVAAQEHSMWVCRGESCSNWCTGTQIKSEIVEVNASYPFSPRAF